MGGVEPYTHPTYQDGTETGIIIQPTQYGQIIERKIDPSSLHEFGLTQFLDPIRTPVRSAEQTDG